MKQVYMKWEGVVLVPEAATDLDIARAWLSERLDYAFGRVAGVITVSTNVGAPSKWRKVMERVGKERGGSDG